MIKLKELQRFAKDGGILENMQVLRQTRLSVSKVTKKEWYVYPDWRRDRGSNTGSEPMFQGFLQHFGPNFDSDIGSGLERRALTQFFHRDFIMSLNDAEDVAALSAPQ